MIIMYMRKRRKQRQALGGANGGPVKSRRSAPMVALTRNVVRASFRNRVAMFFTLGLSVLFMVIFGVLFGGNGVKITFGIVDNDHSAQSRAFIHTLSTIDGVSVEADSLTKAQDQLKNQRVDMYAVIPTGFGSAIAAGAGHAVPVAVQPHTSSASQQTSSLSSQIFGQVLDRYVAVATHAPNPPAYMAQPQQETTNKIAGINFFLPSMLAYIVLQSGINFVAIGLVELRVRNVLRRLRASPITPAQILGAQILGGMLTVFLQLLVLIVLGLTLFGAHMYGSWAVAAVPIVIGTAAFVGIGFMLTSAARTSEAARGLSSMIAFPMMFLSGVFFPITELPNWLQSVVHVLPLTWLSDALHQVLNDGAGFAAIWLDCLVLLAWAVVMISVATWRFRWD